MRESDALANAIANWREILFSVPQEARLRLFEDAAVSVAELICRGFDRVEVAEKLHELAVQVHDGLVDSDTVQHVIAGAIARASAGIATSPLPYVDLTLDLKPREWLVPERIPMRNVTLLSGEGAIGNSLLLMQLGGAVVLVGSEWIGTCPTHGPALYVSCEETDDELRLRIEDVAVHLRTTRQKLAEHGLRFLSFAGHDAILAQPDRYGIIRPTPLFERIRCDALQLKPKLIVLDTVADTFGGDEIKRGQTRQFITMLRGLAIDAESAVVVAAHPSLTGITSDSGLSGSTGWHNGPRARMYFKSAGDDPALRVLEVKKNNYGPVSENILLRWRDGVYVVDLGKGTFEQRMAEVETANLFTDLLRQAAEQGRNVSDKPSPSYAPTVFAAAPKAKAAKATKEALASAMAQLFAANKIAVVPFGPPSRMRTKIIEVSNPPSNPASNPLQPVPTGCAPTPPNTPTPVGRGKGALEAPAPPDGEERAGPAYEVLGSAPPGERCAVCGKAGGVKRIQRGSEVDLWHEDCAKRHLAAMANPPVKIPDEHGAPRTDQE